MAEMDIGPLLYKTMGIHKFKVLLHNVEKSNDGKLFFNALK
jgi:hypothetical protein